jgi:hypothetical protein
MPLHYFNVFEVDRSYYETDARSPILSKGRLIIEDDDNNLDPSMSKDAGGNQKFDFVDEGDVSNYLVRYLDFAQVNGSGPQYELYAMRVDFVDGTTKFYVMSKDEAFNPRTGDDLRVVKFSNFTTTEYGDIGAVVCYGTGTSILTENGQVPVETLRPGDRVQTKDNGCKEVLWAGHRELSAREMAVHPSLRPVVIRPGALGNAHPLRVSQQHRILLPSGVMSAIDSRDEVFVKAKHLAEFCPGIARISPGKNAVGYHHFLLESHEVVFAEVAPSESLLPGAMALKGLSRSDRRELECLLPGFADARLPLKSMGFDLARPTLRRRALAPLLDGLLPNLSPARPSHILSGAWFLA